MSSLRVTELQAWLEAAGAFVLVDVREQPEWELCRLPQARWIPLREFTERAPRELNPTERIVLYCHHGIRSAHAQVYLRELGFTHTFNLIGGIDAWAKEIDSSLARY